MLRWIASGGSRSASFATRLCKSVFRSKKKAVAGAAGRVIRRGASEGGAEQAAVSAFEFDELRHGGGHAEFFRVGGVDAGDERLHKSFEHFAAKPATSERGNAFVSLRRRSRSMQLGHAESMVRRAGEACHEDAQQRRTQDLAEACAATSGKSLRESEPTCPLRTTNARRRDSSVVTSSFSIPSRRQSSRAAGGDGEKIVGRSLDEEAVALDRFEHAAEAAAMLRTAIVWRAAAVRRSRWAAARPLMPPPMIAMRGECEAVVTGRNAIRLVAKPQREKPTRCGGWGSRASRNADVRRSAIRDRR